ncbi:hypothetical protein IFM89_021518, partial [Coptis chinensis]
RYFFFCVSSSLSQFDNFEPKEKTKKLSFFNWWTFSIFFGTLFANTILLYVQDNVGWSVGYGLTTAELAISILIFLVGTPFYRHKVPTGSPFTNMSRVLVAAIRKWRIPVPSDPKELYELDMAEYAKKQKYRIDSTPSLRFLNKVAVKTGSCDPWMLKMRRLGVAKDHGVMGMLNEAYTFSGHCIFHTSASYWSHALRGCKLLPATFALTKFLTKNIMYLAMVLYHPGDMAGAIMQQLKELIINDRSLGLDQPYTAHMYGNMALFYPSLNQTELALRHMSRDIAPTKFIMWS